MFVTRPAAQLTAEPERIARTEGRSAVDLSERTDRPRQIPGPAFYT
jgi:hypothetical protein